MFSLYLSYALQKAHYEILEDDGSFYGSIPDFPGLWANASSLEKCREELLETLEEWIVIRLRNNLDLPVLNNIDLNIKKVA